MQTTNNKFGCTSFLPTLITTTNSYYDKSNRDYAYFLSTNKKQVLDLHLEGPYLNPKKRGTHNIKLIRQPSKKNRVYLCNNHDIIVKIILAPEKVHHSIIRQFNKSEIYISIGYFNATYQQSKQSFDSGVGFETHLLNAMSLLNARESGIMEPFLIHYRYSL